MTFPGPAVKWEVKWEEGGKRARTGVTRKAPVTLGGFLRLAKRALMDTP